MGGAGSKSPRKKELTSISPFPNETNNNNNINTQQQKSNKQPIPVQIKQSIPLSEATKLHLNEDDKFLLTEGQQKRMMLANYEFECSEIFPFLYVGGAKIAQSWDMFVKYNITRVVNCSASVVSNYFGDKPNIKYLTLNMVDGQDEDLSWFVCEVIQYIYRAKQNREVTLLHCEKGVSRSISYAIIYHMWSTGSRWKKSFEYIKARREIANPNVAFLCNLGEIDELFNGDDKTTYALFRFAWHMPHDMTTPVLKICRNYNSRKIIQPAKSLLDPSGIFVVRPIIGEGNNVFVWKGSKITDDYVAVAARLAENMKSVLTNASNVVVIQEGKEPVEFFRGFNMDEPFDPSKHVSFKDLITSSSSIEYPTRGTIPLPSVGSTASLSVPSNLSNNQSPQSTPKGSLRKRSQSNSSVASNNSTTNLSIKVPILQFHSNDQQSYIKTTINRIRSSSKIENFDDSLAGGGIIRQDSKQIIHRDSDKSTPNSGKEDGVGIPEPTVFSRNSNKVQPEPVLGSSNSTARLPEEPNVNSSRKDDGVPIAESTISPRKSNKVTPEPPLGNSNSNSRLTETSIRFTENYRLTDASTRFTENNRLTDTSNRFTENNRSTETSTRFTDPMPTNTAVNISRNDVGEDDDGVVIIRRPTTPRASYNYSRPSSRNISIESTNSAANNLRKDRSNKALSLNLTSTLGRSNKISSIDQFDNVDINQSPNLTTNIPTNLSINTTQAQFSSPRMLNPSSSNTALSLHNLTVMGQHMSVNGSSHPSPLFAHNNSNSMDSPGARSNPRSGSRPVTPLISPNPQLSPVMLGHKSTLYTSRRSSNIDRTISQDIVPGLSPSLRSTTFDRESSMSSRPSTPHLPIDKIISKSNSKVDVKLPVEISLMRDATPATRISNELPVNSNGSPITSGRRSDGQPSDETNSAGVLSARLLLKPLLFQAKLNSKNIFEWISMGLYDDDDLDEKTILLLLCPESPHYVWIGSDFTLPDNLSTYPNDIPQWICNNIDLGEMLTMKDKLGYLLPINRNDILIERADAESQGFWDAFNEGF